MTPKEKANELIEEYLSLNDNFNKPIVTDEQDAVKCAIIAVDEILDELKRNPHYIYKRIEFWQAVKSQLEILKN